MDVKNGPNNQNAGRISFDFNEDKYDTDRWLWYTYFSPMTEDEVPPSLLTAAKTDTEGNFYYDPLTGQVLYSHTDGWYTTGWTDNNDNKLDLDDFLAGAKKRANQKKRTVKITNNG
jgi:hypothetical protein